MTDSRFLSPIFLLFARQLAKTPPFPADNDGIKFNFALNQWELSPFGGAGEANTSSNVGAGLGWALPKVGVDLPFKSFIAISPLSIVSNPNDITISLTGAVTVNTFILGFQTLTALGGAGTKFFGFFGSDRSATENDVKGFLGFAITIKKITVNIETNTSSGTVDIVMRKDGVDVPNTLITIPVGTSGKFDTGAISELIASGSLINMSLTRNGGAMFNNFSILVECEK